MENLDLKELNIKEISGIEMREINGGVIIETMLGIAVGWALGRLVRKLFSGE